MSKNKENYTFYKVGRITIITLSDSQEIFFSFPSLLFLPSFLPLLPLFFSTYFTKWLERRNHSTALILSLQLKDLPQLPITCREKSAFLKVTLHVLFFTDPFEELPQSGPSLIYPKVSSPCLCPQSSVLWE